MKRGADATRRHPAEAAARAPGRDVETAPLLTLRRALPAAALAAGVGARDEGLLELRPRDHARDRVHRRVAEHLLVVLGAEAASERAVVTARGAAPDRRTAVAAHLDGEHDLGVV